MREITLRYPRELRDLWHKGKLHEVWFWEYRGLFDKLDLSNAKGQCRKQHEGFHFGEWFVAIHFFRKGYRVLTEKYALKSRRAKWPILASLVGNEGLAFLTSKKVKRPDLFIHHPRHKRFFFVEVKLESDTVRDKQKSSFGGIEEKLGCRVLIANLKAA